MAQRIWSAINPNTTSGVMLAAILTDFKDALVSGYAGTSRPANLQAGGIWINTTNQAAPNYYWSVNIYTGSTDIEIFRISILYGLSGTFVASSEFEITKISADTVAPILELIKNRIANNAQVLSGDTIGEIRFVGRTNTSTNPVVGYINFTSTDDNTTSAYGGTLTMYSVPDATNTATAHLRLINGQIETLVAHKKNSLILVSQNVATTATIAQLSAAKPVVEMTGSTATDIQGINSSHDSKVVTIHNRSTAVVTLKHQNGTASANDRLKLPNSLDHSLSPQESCTLYYCTTDTRWKLRSAVNKKLSEKTIEKFHHAYQEWECPAGVTSIEVKVFPPKVDRFNPLFFLDPYGNAYGWAANPSGQLGNGATTNTSSPVAVIGGLTFDSIGNHIAPHPQINDVNGGLVKGTLYLWGANALGQLGVGNTTNRSSPVAVLGGLKFSFFYNNNFGSAFAITPNNKLYAWGVNSVNGSSIAIGALGLGDIVDRSSPVAVVGGVNVSRMGYSGSQQNFITTDGDGYAWGNNSANGGLGVGDTTDRSTPTLILGGLKWKKIIIGDNTGIGLTIDNDLYAWGLNDRGQLGLGDVDKRSSPVAVLGGLKFKDFFRYAAGNDTVLAITEDGTPYAWGRNTNGELGVGDTTDRSSPVAVLGGLKFKWMHTNTFSSFGLTEDGTLYGWGDNSAGQLGLGDVTPRSSPVAVLGGLKWGLVQEYGTFAVYAVTDKGDLYSWGNGNQGTLGHGDFGVAKSSPVAVVGPAFPGLFSPMHTIRLDVTPGNTYPIVLSHGSSSFGDTPIGTNVDSISIEYGTD